MTADTQPGQERQLTDREKYPIPFNFLNGLRENYGMEDLGEIAGIFETAGYLVSQESLKKGVLEVSTVPQDGSDPHPQLIVLNPPQEA